MFLLSNYKRVLGILLLLVAFAKLTTVFGDSDILTMRDPVFRLEHASIALIAGVIECVLGLSLLLRRDLGVVLVSCLFFGLGLAWYRVGIWMLGYKTCPCLGNLGDHLGLNADLVSMVLKVMIAYMVIGSGYHLLSKNDLSKQS